MPSAGVDKARIEKAVREILEAVGANLDDDNFTRTPERVAEMYDEVFAGLRERPEDVLSVTFEAEHEEMILLKNIDMVSMCAHHLVPFIGKAHVAYIPSEDGRVTGLSKLARLVDIYARRPQVQERLTGQIADALERVLQPRGVLVVVEAEHLCMSGRGVKKPGASTITSAVRGLFLQDARTRAEAMAFIHGHS
jgi:GTP cyclohydrolase I